MSDEKPLLEVHGLTKVYALGRMRFFGPSMAVQAVAGIDFCLGRNETLGLVGESGCGKSTTARILAGIEKPTSGSICFEGKELIGMSARKRKAIRPKIQMIFQDHDTSLNPRRRVFDILVEPMLYHGLVTKKEAKDRVYALLEMVGLPKHAANRYPAEFSGGQRQRISIARALSLRPEILICDEPVSALDVSIQAQILNLLKDLQKKLGVAYLFIAHGLGAVHYISDRIAVMYLGKIVEMGEEEAVFHCPLHPYSQLLIATVPIADPTRRTLDQAPLKGEAPETGALKEGCSFASRCPLATEKCFKNIPIMEDRVDEAGHVHHVACFHAQGRRIT